MSSACSFIFMQIKVIFIIMVSPLDSLWNRGTRELGNGLLFCVHTTPKKGKTPTITGHFEFLFAKETRSGQEPSHGQGWVTWGHRFSRSSIFKTSSVMSVHTQTNLGKLVFSNCSSLKSVSEKLRFRDGLFWTVGQNVEIKQCFQIY